MTERGAAAVEMTGERHTWSVLAISAAVGFCLGALVYPMWTDNVESAQVQAHLIDYGQWDVMRVYHSTAYSIVIQIAAVLLRLGVPEWTLSSVFSGLQGALSCSALALFALAISRSAIVSFLVPVLLLRFRTEMSEWPSNYLAVFHGHHYPNFFPNHTSLYGIVGLFWMVLVFSLFSLRKVKTASVLLGLMPGIHVALAPACAAGALGAALFLRTSLRPWWPLIVRYTAIGLAISAGSALFHVAFEWRTPPNVPSAEIERVASAFVRVWDIHSAPLQPGEWRMFFESEYYTLFLTLSLLTYLRSYLTPSARVIVVAVASVTILAICYTLFVTWYPDLIGWRVRSLLITRWLNLSSFAFPVLALSLLGSLTFRFRDALAALALVITAVMVFIGYPLAITGAGSIGAAPMHEITTVHAYLFPLFIVLSACVLGFLHEQRIYLSYPVSWSNAMAVAALSACVASLQLHQFSRIDADRVRGKDAFTEAMSVLSHRKGTLVVGERLWWAGRIQLRTRRPLLIDPGQLNMLLKVPASGPRMEYILSRVYDVPSLGAGQFSLDRDWPQHTPEFWRGIRAEFGVKDVFVSKEVELQLPKLYGNDYVSIYTIPSE